MSCKQYELPIPRPVIHGLVNKKPRPEYDQKSFVLNPDFLREDLQMYDSQKIIREEEEKHRYYYSCVTEPPKEKRSTEFYLPMFSESTDKVQDITGVVPMLEQPWNKIGPTSFNRESHIIRGEPNRVGYFFCHDREKSINRFEPLSRDLQAFAVEPFIRLGVNTSSLNKQIHTRALF